MSYPPQHLYRFPYVVELGFVSFYSLVEEAIKISQSDLKFPPHLLLLLSSDLVCIFLVHCFFAIFFSTIPYFPFFTSLVKYKLVFV